MAAGSLSCDRIVHFLNELYAQDVHAKRVLSLAQATAGVVQTGSLAVNAIGRGLALARGRSVKHATKQVDRLLSNDGIELATLLSKWVPHVIGARSRINVAMDWTDFDADGHATLMLALIGDHGRATPLLWRTVDKATLKDQRGGYEHHLLVWLAELAPAHVRVRIVADRGFADCKLYRLLTDELKFDFVIRFRADVLVDDLAGHIKPASAWLGPRGRAKMLRPAWITGQGHPVGTVVCVRDKGMKDPWCLVSNSTDETARTLINLYGRRWSIECGFRDIKDIRFGMGMGSIRVKSPERRDRLWLLSAFAITLLTLLGAAGEALGYDRLLKTNTAKHRTLSLFRQGCMLYEQIPNMPDERLQPLMERFSTDINALPTMKAVFGTI